MSPALYPEEIIWGVVTQPGAKQRGENSGSV